jgi:DNA-binding MarR family transcriptional regulator
LHAEGVYMKNFGQEITKIIPALHREGIKKQMPIFTKNKISISQVIILDFLTEKGACKMSDLAKVIGCTMSAVTGFVDKLIDLKFVTRERSSEDRRVVYVALSKKGEKIVEQIKQKREEVVNDLFGVLSQEEKKEYVRLLKKIYEGLKN